MFDPTSRYARLATKTLKNADGREVTYVERRFLPKGEELQILAEVTVEQSDRLDLISARVLGNPLMFWQICDANNAMDPFELVKEPNKKLIVPVPQS